MACVAKNCNRVLNPLPRYTSLLGDALMPARMTAHAPLLLLAVVVAATIGLVGCGGGGGVGGGTGTVAMQVHWPASGTKGAIAPDRWDHRSTAPE